MQDFYLHIESREELFRALTEHALDERLLRLLDAKIGHLHRASRESEYGGWLIEQTNQLSADLLEKDRRTCLGVLGRLFRDEQDAGEIATGLARLTPVTPATLEATLVAEAHRLARDDARFMSERVFVQRLRGLVRMAINWLC